MVVNDELTAPAVSSSAPAVESASVCPSSKKTVSLLDPPFTAVSVVAEPNGVSTLVDATLLVAPDWAVTMKPGGWAMTLTANPSLTVTKLSAPLLTTQVTTEEVAVATSLKVLRSTPTPVPDNELALATADARAGVAEYVAPVVEQVRV